MSARARAPGRQSVLVSGNFHSVFLHYNGSLRIMWIRYAVQVQSAKKCFAHGSWHCSVHWKYVRQLSIGRTTVHKRKFRNLTPLLSLVNIFICFWGVFIYFSFTAEVQVKSVVILFLSDFTLGFSVGYVRFMQSSICKVIRLVWSIGNSERNTRNDGCLFQLAVFNNVEWMSVLCPICLL